MLPPSIKDYAAETQDGHEAEVALPKKSANGRVTKRATGIGYRP